ncbi:hypothetical protein SS50377_26243 [Spironucleus salmonicida]|uniref:Uncharacterized protein n=1 Tax=Spironucleus salmonicida TaxID=348837 RepID=V6LWL2_9EUKA|nr:hypothetical protein SS50377_26243 [Spironucleus salmonicida]|eukprot:EST48101.1 Hypothetical protein SS50377_11764 [Spironucleus salmonicida]
MGGCAQNLELRTVLVLGHPGTGKTRLMQEITGFEPALDPHLGALVALHGALRLVEPLCDDQARARWIHQLHPGCALVYVVGPGDAQAQLYDLQVLSRSEAVRGVRVVIFADEEVPDFETVRTTDDLQGWLMALGHG